jgi:hypothetical protein
MCYDNSNEVERIGDRNIKRFTAIGMVVCNDGVNTIWVVWSNNCHDQFKEYDVRYLNPRVITRIE